jgi:hypothetical protein
LVLAGFIGFAFWIPRAKEGTRDLGAGRALEAKREHSGAVAVPTPIDEAEGPKAEARLPEVARLPISGILEGRVRWPNGQLVDEVSLTLRAIERGAKGPDGWMDAPVLDGSFAIQGLDAGSYFVVAWKHVTGWTGNRFDASVQVGWWLAFAELPVPRGDPLELILSPMESIRGQVFGPDGLGLRAFQVQAAPLKLQRGFEDLLRVYFHDDWGFESPDGSFDLVGLLPGEWRISAGKDGYAAPVPIRIDVPRKESLSFHLVRTVELNGRIVDSAGEHLRGRAIVTWAEAGDSVAAGEDAETTWGNGLFRLHAPPTTVDLRATFEGRQSEPILLDLTMGRPRDELLLVVPRKE